MYSPGAAASGCSFLGVKKVCGTYVYMALVGIDNVLCCG